VTFVGTVTLAPRFVIELAIVLFVVILVVVTFLQSTSLEASYPLIGMFGVAALRLAPGITMVLSNVSVLRNQQHGVSVIAEDLSSVACQNLDFGVSVQPSEREQFSSLKLDRVTFAYDQESDSVLKEVVLSIEAGECVGLIGASGSGKTTLVDVMLGLLEPQEGEILFNGRPLPLALNAWQSNIAYLPQEVFLISGTIRENIALGCEPHEIDENLIQQSLRQAQLNELVGLLPHGVNTHIGERGVRLSGGQRQRVALARALYHKRGILVLDEATSALDDDTEREIVKEIQELKGEKTMIVIAHRLTTLRHCDRIYRLDKGRIVESGPYEEVVLSAGKSDRRQ